MALSNFVRACLLFAFVLSVMNERAHGLMPEHQQQPLETLLRSGPLQLDKPQDVVQTEGGSIRSWCSSDILRCTQVDICETTLRENGLAIPKYIDAPSIAYIMQGCGMLGISYPYEGEFRQKYYVRRVKAGDVVAVPKGVVIWLCNDGREEQRVMCAADTSKATNPGGTVKPFFLSGAKTREFSGLWHGFSEDTIAQALGVDESTVRKLLTSQKDAVITKTRHKISLPFPERRRQHENAAGAEFTYTTECGKADLVVKNGGWMSMVTRNKLPMLAHVGMSAVRVNLEPEAMIAPLWSPNAHQIVRVQRGNGKIEVASNNGDRLLHTDLKENDLIVIPKFFPSTIIAGENGLDLIKILTCDSPVASYFAGGNSVYKGIPPQVLAEAFSIDLEEELDIRRRRTKHEVILPACKQGRREHQRSHEDDHCQQASVEDLNDKGRREHQRNHEDDHCQQASVENSNDEDRPSLVEAVLSWADEHF
ncbi:hypothetical protein L7F22_058418 [Adiantum nelumboides]|nr:hypothetical protein [Adiantum nelumboides]